MKPLIINRGEKNGVCVGTSTAFKRFHKPFRATRAYATCFNFLGTHIAFMAPTKGDLVTALHGFAEAGMQLPRWSEKNFMSLAVINTKRFRKLKPCRATN